MRRILSGRHRRLVLGVTILAALVLAGGLNSRWIWMQAPGQMTLTAAEAYEMAAADRITLIDIRRPDEWAATGIGVGAVPLDMRRDDFEVELDRLMDGPRDVPIALICARGVRSAHLSRRLDDAGYAAVIDVPEGMLGSVHGPGWLARGLPVRQP